MFELATNKQKINKSSQTIHEFTLSKRDEDTIRRAVIDGEKARDQE